jgi:hypothetical protein
MSQNANRERKQMIAELITDANALFNKVDKYIATGAHTVNTSFLETARGAVSLASGNLNSHAAAEAEAAEKAKAAAPATAATPAATPAGQDATAAPQS